MVAVQTNQLAFIFLVLYSFFDFILRDRPIKAVYAG